MHVGEDIRGYLKSLDFEIFFVSFRHDSLRLRTKLDNPSPRKPNAHLPFSISMRTSIRAFFLRPRLLKDVLFRQKELMILAGKHPGRIRVEMRMLRKRVKNDGALKLRKSDGTSVNLEKRYDRS